MLKNILIALTLLFYTFHFSFLSQANTIKLGMSNALTGPASQLGHKLSTGSSVYFEQVNILGGINGQQVELISLDDGYEPENTISNTIYLIEKEKVAALFGYVGTPTSHAILPLIKKSNIPYLMPFTGADFLRSPINKNIFNLRASYSQEAHAQVKYLVENKGLKKIALVIQADEFGLAAQRSYIESLAQYNIVPVINERFKRNSNDIKTVLTHLTQQPIDAVIFVGTYQPFSHLINLSYEKGIQPFFSSLSFASSNDVFSRLKYPSKVIISQVMPEPLNCNWDICQQFIKDMKNAGYKQFDRLQLEGYINAHIFNLVAQQCGTQLTSSCLIDEFESFIYKSQGLDISFSVTDHQGFDQVYLSYSEALIKNE